MKPLSRATPSRDGMNEGAPLAHPVVLSQKSGGWTVPLVCLTLMIGAAMLAATLQRTLADQERAAASRLRSLQAQAVAEGLLSRTLALLDESSAVDERCRVTAPQASLTPHSTQMPQPTGASAPGFRERMLQVGARLSCRVALHGEPGPGAWECQCTSATVATPSGMHQEGRTPPPLAQADLRIEAGPGDLLRAVVQAQVLETPGTSAVELGSAALPEDTPVWRFSVLLQADPRGVWREKAGSWNDLP